jgi:hypothetical protein
MTDREKGERGWEKVEEGEKIMQKGEEGEWRPGGRRQAEGGKEKSTPSTMLDHRGYIISITCMPREKS